MRSYVARPVFKSQFGNYYLGNSTTTSYLLAVYDMHQLMRDQLVRCLCHSETNAGTDDCISATKYSVRAVQYGFIGTKLPLQIYDTPQANRQQSVAFGLSE